MVSLILKLWTWGIVEYMLLTLKTLVTLGKGQQELTNLSILGEGLSSLSRPTPTRASGTDTLFRQPVSPTPPLQTVIQAFSPALLL